MAPKFKRAETFDEYTTQRVDVIQNKLFGDYNAKGVYVINKKVAQELVNFTKSKKESYNNDIFCSAKTSSGQTIDFEISFKKNTASQLAVAELCVLEGVPKQGGRMVNVIKTPISKFTSEITPDFVDRALKKFNVTINEDDSGQERKDVDDQYIAKRNVLLGYLDNLSADSYNIMYEDFFTQRVNLLKTMNNPYTKKILEIFNNEFNNISDFFLLDKKSKKVVNYKAMNELLDKAFEDLYGLDEYAEQEKDFKQRLLPILGIFINGAARIDETAKKKVLDAVPKRMKDSLAEPLHDVNLARKSDEDVVVKEANQEQVANNIKDKLKDIATKVKTKDSGMGQGIVSGNQSSADKVAKTISKSVPAGDRNYTSVTNGPDAAQGGSSAEQNIISSPGYNYGGQVRQGKDNGQQGKNNIKDNAGGSNQYSKGNCKNEFDLGNVDENSRSDIGMNAF